MLNRTQFEGLIADALLTLPPLFREKMSNVEILIERWPTSASLKQLGVPVGHTLFGLYHGIPLTKRNHAYNLVTPDTITLFQGPIEEKAGSDINEIKKLVRHTVIHELAHHFGISDDRLRELGAY